MKIILLGEYSGFHSALAAGLRRKGCDAVVISDGDGFKRIKADIDISAQRSGVIGKIHRNAAFYKHATIHKDADVLQVINACYPHLRFFSKWLMWHLLRKSQRRLFVSACGSDAFYWSKGRSELDYGPFDDVLKYDKKNQKHRMLSQGTMSLNKYVAEKVDGIIPVMYDYHVGYVGHNKLRKPIPLPINLCQLDYLENKVINKVKIFHGVSRYGFKGTRHVEGAFKIIEDKFPGCFDLVIADRLPQSEYITELTTSNIVVDQVNTHSYGMNALIAMALGKVVVSGSEPKAMRYLGTSGSPVVNGLPNSIQLADAILSVADSSSLAVRGEVSRRYVEQFHCSDLVADRYLSEWQEP